MGKRKQTSVRRSREGDAVPTNGEESAFLVSKRVEHPGENLLQQLPITGLLNETVRNYSDAGVRTFTKSDVRVLPDRVFETLEQANEMVDRHPHALETAKKIADPFGLEIKPGTIGEAGGFTDGFGRSPYIYLRKRIVGYGAAKAKTLPPHLQKEGMIVLTSLYVGDLLLEENLHRSCQPRSYPVDTERQQAAVKRIIWNDTYSHFSPLGRDAVTAYANSIIDYLKNRRVIILSSGLNILIETERKTISAAQYNADETATLYFIRPMLEKFVGLLGERYPLLNTILFLNPGLEQQIKQPSGGSKTSHAEVNEQTVVGRLARLSGPSYEEQLEFYLSGEYFKRHLALMSNEPFLP